MIIDACIAENESVAGRAANWAESRADIAAVGVVGSWARGNPREDSDVDFIVLTSNKATYTADETEKRDVRMAV